MSESQKDSQQERGFVVIDRRGRSDEERDEAETREPAQAAAEPKPATAAPQATSRAEQASLPPIDFASFVHSIAISALYHLGLVPERETGKPATPNLELARENIDILEMLQNKTRGNLEPDEAQLLESLLFDLRMRFVEAKRPGAG